MSGWVNAAGVLGALLISGLYLVNQMGRLETTDWRFPGGNLLGSAMIGLSLVVDTNLPSVLIEMFWSAISVYGLVRALRRTGRKVEPAPGAAPPRGMVPARGPVPGQGVCAGRE